MEKILDDTKDRDLLEVLGILGHIYFLQGCFRESRIVFEGLLSLDENNVSAHKHLVALALEQKEGKEALRRLNASPVPVGQDELPWQIMRAQALRLSGQEEEARRVIKEYLAVLSNVKMPEAKQG